MNKKYKTKEQIELIDELIEFTTNSEFRKFTKDEKGVERLSEELKIKMDELTIKIKEEIQKLKGIE